MRSNQQLDKILKITFANLSRKSDEKGKKKQQKKQTRMAIAKLFAFYANTKMIEVAREIAALKNFRNRKR